MVLTVAVVTHVSCRINLGFHDGKSLEMNDLERAISILLVFKLR